MNTLIKRIAAAHLAKTAGGADFEVYVPGSDPKKAFLWAKEEAEGNRGGYGGWGEDEDGEGDGEGGYSGTILEKDSFELRSKKLMTLAEAKSFARRDLSKNNKWGPAFVVPVAKSSGDKVIGFLFYGIASS